MSATAVHPDGLGGPAPIRRRGRRRLIAAAVLVILAAQLWVAARNMGRIRAVLYNDGPGPITDAMFVCAGESMALGDMEEEQSRYLWFYPQERSVVLVLGWRDASGRHESAWAAGQGERLTVRVRAEGFAEVSRQRSLGRVLIDFLGFE